MVERLLRMQEVWGSMPHFSIIFLHHHGSYKLQEILSYRLLYFLDKMDSYSARESISRATSNMPPCCYSFFVRVKKKI